MAGLSQSTADQATKLHDAWQRSQQQIRSNEHLSPAGKQVALAKAYLPYAAQLDALNRSDTDTSASTIERLQRDVFGAQSLTGADAISFRDAQDRAAQISTPAEAMMLIQRARQSGDDMLSRAIGRQVWEHANDGLFGGQMWGEPMQAWADSRPGVGEKLNQLSDLEKSRVSDPITRAMYLSPQKATELRGVTDSQLAALAATPDAALV